ncbi:MAG TPA: hypothetical protein VNZ52_13240 [Candidatus Thermoplasmatota archaeon]|nr:hypothetical protein [Candidatus Thermoplasmatota archaeon]
MVSETVRKLLLPGGIAAASLGLVAAFYGYTGDRTYDITYFYLVVFGGVLMVGGVMTSAYGRAMAPRGRAAKPGAKKPEPAAAKAKEKPAKQAEAPTVSVPVKAKKGPQPERFVLLCPQCDTKFEAEGVRPLTATCPTCALQAPIP